MEIKDIQINAHSFATLMNDRAKARPGYVPIVCVNAEGQSVTKYSPLLAIKIVVGDKEMEFGEFLQFLYDDISKKDKTISELTVLYNETKAVADKAIQVAENMEKYMPTDYIGL
jgi:hypothetical protein